MYCAFASSMFAAVVDSVYDKVEVLHKAILYQNNPTKNYELEFT
jgi:hypothetical protein